MFHEITTTIVAGARALSPNAIAAGAGAKTRTGVSKAIGASARQARGSVLCLWSKGACKVL